MADVASTCGCGCCPRLPERRSYTHFSRCGKLLDAALEKAGAVRLAERVDVNKEDWPVVDAWLAAVLAALAQQTLQTIGSLGGERSTHAHSRGGGALWHMSAQLQAGMLVCCGRALLPGVWPSGAPVSCRPTALPSVHSAVHRADPAVHTPPGRRDSPRPPRAPPPDRFLGAGLPGDGEQASAKQPAAKKWGRSRPYTATMVALEPLCTLSAQDDKNTVRAEFDLGGSGMTYLPGDALGIYPLNGPEVRGRIRGRFSAKGLVWPGGGWQGTGCGRGGQEGAQAEP